MNRKLFWLLLVPVFAWFGRDGGQSQTLVNFFTQVSPVPSIVVAQYATCTGLPNCAGMQYAQFKMSDGTTRGLFWLIPTDPSFSLNTNWTSIPVIAPGTTGISCAQVKP